MAVSAYRVHQAMQDAPHDGKDFRQARAAVGNVLVQLRVELFYDRHSEDACPCRKRHHVAPKPAAPDAPPNQGKAARRFREAFDKLLEASDSGDENAMTAAALAVPRTLELANYATAYEHYVEALRGWSPEICGDCGASLLAVTGTGCARCLPADITSLLQEKGPQS